MTREENAKYDTRQVQFHRTEVAPLEFFSTPSHQDLRLHAYGAYQMKQPPGYYADCIDENGDLEQQTAVARCSTSSTTKKYQIETQANNGVFIEVKLLSGRSNNFKYFLYVLIDESETGLQAIIAHVCGCEVGERVAGCCSRVATRSPGALDLLECKHPPTHRQNLQRIISRMDLSMSEEDEDSS